MPPWWDIYPGTCDEYNACERWKERALSSERERDEARKDRDYWAAEAQKDYAAIKEVEQLHAEVARLQTCLQAIGKLSCCDVAANFAREGLNPANICQD